MLLGIDKGLEVKAKTEKTEVNRIQDAKQPEDETRVAGESCFEPCRMRWKCCAKPIDRGDPAKVDEKKLRNGKEGNDKEANGDATGYACWLEKLFG